MGPRLGIFRHDMESYPSSKFDKMLDSNVYPAAPLVSSEEWQNIIDYYIATSPDTLPPQKREHSILIDSLTFRVQKLTKPFNYSSTSFVKAGIKNKPYNLIASDVVGHTTFFYDSELKIVDSIHMAGPVVNLDFKDHEIIVCNIGILNPNNGKFGSAISIKTDDQEKILDSPGVIFKNLQRPVEITSSDLNGDGRTDYLICEFGFVTGALSWMENTENGNYIRHVLRPLPGAIKTYIDDFNKDGLPDIMVLFAQGDESVILYTNKGKGNFSEKVLLRFPASYGSSYFELADFNGDGSPDILYTCGDNADYSPVLKPYHGVYIYLNDGPYNFTQQFFFPIHGCYKAIAKDFDKDGDLDEILLMFVINLRFEKI